MDDAGLVRLREAKGDLDSDVECVGNTERTALNPGRQRLAGVSQSNRYMNTGAAR